jgi:quercetin dioxygenase-like cupin family protein
MLTTNSNEILNTRTGQRMIFKSGEDAEGHLLEMECFSPSSAMKEPEHIHPFQENSFEVISGKMSFSVNGKVQIIGPEESIIISKGVPHFFWNDSGTEAHYIQYFKPALQIENFFRTFFTLARENRLNNNGLPNIFLISIISLKYQNEIRLVKPPWVLQKMIFSILSPIGKWLGYKASHPSI